MKDIPILHDLSELGLCRTPKYLPPWAEDIRFLLCYLTYSTPLNKIALGHVRTHYDEMLSAIPKS